MRRQARRDELAVTVLRSIGLISRNDNPYRQDPAGPEIAIPDAQMRGRRRIDFALFPHAGDWLAGGVVAAAERYRHPYLSAPGAGVADASVAAGARRRRRAAARWRWGGARVAAPPGRRLARGAGREPCGRAAHRHPGGRRRRRRARPTCSGRRAPCCPSSPTVPSRLSSDRPRSARSRFGAANGPGPGRSARRSRAAPERVDAR